MGKREKSPKKKSGWKRLVVILGAAGAAGYALWKRLAGSERPATCVSGERIVLKNEDDLSGVGLVMENMISKYVEDPAKVMVLEGLNLVIAIVPDEEPESAITMTFADGRAVIEPGVAYNADITLTCDYEVLMELPKMGAGIQTVKYLMTPEGKEVVGKFMSGKIKVRGITAHAPQMLRLSKFLAVSP